jgi:cytochrome c553
MRWLMRRPAQRLGVAALAALSALAAPQVFAAGDASAGQAKSAICAACHGVDGNSVVPNWQVSLIKAGARMVPEMVGIVPGLSEQDIEDLSAYFAAQPIAAGVADESQLVLGERIFRAGNAESGVPACMACHGPAGEGNPLAGYPALAGQHAVYTANMLNRFRAGENWGEGDASEVMNGSAARLTDDEIAAVASYIQGLYLASE